MSTTPTKVPSGSPALDLSKASIRAAREELTTFAMLRAAETFEAVGFGYVGVPEAPDTYAKLWRTYHDCQEHRFPLPVSNKNLVGSLLLHRGADLALRYWHDTSHISHNRTFSAPDELDLGLWHVAVGKALGLSPLALALLDADFVGQTLLYAATKSYAVHQRRFDVDVVMFGVADAILLERERQAQRAAA